MLFAYRRGLFIFLKGIKVVKKPRRPARNDLEAGQLRQRMRSAVASAGRYFRTLTPEELSQEGLTMVERNWVVKKLLDIGIFLEYPVRGLDLNTRQFFPKLSVEAENNLVRVLAELPGSVVATCAEDEAQKKKLGANMARVLVSLPFKQVEEALRQIGLECPPALRVFHEHYQKPVLPPAPAWPPRASAVTE